MLHRSRRPRDGNSFAFQALTGSVDVGDTDGEMAESGAQFIGFGLVPVVGQFNDGVLGLVAVADEYERELAAGVMYLLS